MKPSRLAKLTLSKLFQSLTLSSLALSSGSGALVAIAQVTASQALATDYADGTTITSDTTEESITITASGAVSVTGTEEDNTALTTGELTFSGGSSLSIDANSSVSVTGLFTFDKTDSITNYGTLNLSGTYTFSYNAYSSITNYNSLSISSVDTMIDFTSYNHIYNEEGATLSIDTGTSYIRIRAGATITNLGNGSVNITAAQIYWGGKIINAADGTITVGTITSSVSGGSISNGGVGNFYITSSLSLASDNFATNSGAGTLAMGEIKLTGTASATNSGEGTLYICSGSIASGTSLVNGDVSTQTASGTLSIGASTSYVDAEGDTITLTTNSSNDFTLAAGSSITNYEGGTLSLNGMIVLEDTGLITNNGYLDLGSNLIFDISSLSTDENGIYQIFSTDSTGDINLTSLTSANITGYDSSLDPDDYVVTFNTTGGLTICITGLLEYSGSGGSIKLSDQDIFDNGAIYQNGSSSILTFDNPSSEDVTETTLLVDTGADSSIKKITVGENYDLTLNAEEGSTFAIGTLELTSSSSLTITSDDISVDSVTASSTASVTLGGTGQKYSLAASNLASSSTSATYILGSGNSLTLTGGEDISIYASLTMEAGASRETASSLILASVSEDDAYTLKIENSGSGITSTSDTDNGYIVFDIGENVTLNNAHYLVVDSGTTIVIAGSGTFYSPYKIVNDASSNTAASGVTLLIEGGTFQLANSNSKFNSIIIETGGCFELTSSSISWDKIATTIYLEGGTFKDSSTKSGNVTTTSIFNLVAQGGSSTLDFTDSSLSSMQIYSLTGGETADDGTISLKGDGSFTLKLDSIENFNGTIDNSAGTASIEVSSISNTAGQSTNFKGDISSSALTKTGDGDLSFENLSATSLSMTGEGTLSVSESVTIGTITLSTSSSAASPVTYSTLATSNNITITYTGDGESGSITGDTITALAINNALLSSSADITLDTVSLNSVQIEAASSTVTLNNMGSVSDSSINAETIILNLSEGNGLEILTDESSLTYIITALEGFTDVSGDITLALDLTSDQELAFSNALSEGTNVSIVINSETIYNMDADAQNAITVDINNDYTVDLAGNVSSSAADFQIDMQVIPEPSSTSLGLLALAGLIMRRRRR